MERTAALAATFLRRFFHAHPMSPRGAFRIQTLHRPTWKLLHFTSHPQSYLGYRGELPVVVSKKLLPRKTGGIVRRCF
jgi:hypothetical protein